MMISRRSSPVSQWIFLAGVLTVLFALASIGSYKLWIHGADHRDFYPRWAGARLYLEGSKDLYSMEATQRIQNLLYGKTIPSTQDQQGFAYPGYSLPFLIPFALIPDVEVATAIWEGFTLILLLLSIYLVQHANRQKVDALPTILLLLWSYTLLVLFQGQITGLIIASLAFGYWAFQKGKYLMGGFLLSVGFIKPELVILPIVALIVHAVLQKRVEFLLGIVLGFTLLIGISIWMLGFWIGDWYAALLRYTQYAETTWTPGFVWGLSPVLAIALLAFVVIAYLQLYQDEGTAFAAAIPVQIMLFPQTLIWGISTLCIPLIFIWQRGARVGFFTIWIVGWIAFLALSSPGVWDWQTLIIPLASLGVFAYQLFHDQRSGVPRVMEK